MTLKIFCIFRVIEYYVSYLILCNVYLCRFLEEAVMNLDVNNPTTREHMPIVLNNLRLQLQRFINNNPNHKLTRSMKVLVMASQSLLAA